MSQLKSVGVRENFLTLPQFLVLTLVAYAWFECGISTVWMQTPASSLATFSMKPSPSPSDSSLSTSQYALLAAFTHSLALVGGQIMCEGANKVGRRTGGKTWRGMGYSTGMAVGFMAVTISATFYSLQWFFHREFENKTGVSYEQASLFFYDQPNSSRFYALFSSCSYIFWILAGVMVRSSSDQFVGIFPKLVHKHFLKLVFMLGGR